MSGVLNCQQALRRHRLHTHHTQVTELIVELDNERNAHMLLLAYGGCSVTTATACKPRNGAFNGGEGGGGGKGGNRGGSSTTLTKEKKFRIPRYSSKPQTSNLHLQGIKHVCSASAPIGMLATALNLLDECGDDHRKQICILRTLTLQVC
jgi:hypothetical protein